MQMIVFLFIIASFNHLIYGSQYSFINCTWPCSNSNDKCVITTTSASCQPLTSNDWIMNSPTRSPVYTGPAVTRPSRSCIPVPIPQLPLASQNSTPAIGQSIIYWPITNTTRRVQDDYLGNCGHSLYCYQSSCVTRLTEGSLCNSSNQCAYGFCDNSTCLPLTKRSSNYRKPQDHKAVVAIASVFGVLGAVVLSALIYRYRKVFFRTKKQTTAQTKVDESKEETESPPPYEP